MKRSAIRGGCPYARSQLVARMERSGMRGRSFSWSAGPGLRFAPSGLLHHQYARERRQSERTHARDFVIVPLRSRRAHIQGADALALADQRNVDAGMQAKRDDGRVIVERFA